jgi:predicted Zn-dependent peptidase
MKERDSIALGLWVGVGGRYEDDRLKGAAHFLEHILFKGSRNYSCDEIKTLIEGVGGTLNAFTSEEQTCYYAKIPSQHLSQTFDVLADMVADPKIDSKDVSKEKTVIVEEIKMYHDLPQYFVLELLDALVWPGHPLGKNLAGTPETVMGMSSADLRGFHLAHYSPANIVVSACGNLRHEKIVGLVKKSFGKLRATPRKSFVGFDAEQTQPRTHFFKKDSEQAQLALGIPGFDERHKDKYVLSLLSIILGGNMSSRLFVEVREKRGLAYSISCSYKALHDTGLFLVRAGVDNQKIVEAMTLVFRELDKIKRLGVNQSEFQRAREYLLGQLLLGLEDTMDHMLWLGDSLISKDETKTLKSIIKIFEKIKKEDIKRVAKDVLNARSYNLAVVGPVTAQQEKQLAGLLTV